MKINKITLVPITGEYSDIEKRSFVIDASNHDNLDILEELVEGIHKGDSNGIRLPEHASLLSSFIDMSKDSINIKVNNNDNMVKYGFMLETQEEINDAIIKEYISGHIDEFSGDIGDTPPLDTTWHINNIVSTTILPGRDVTILYSSNNVLRKSSDNSTYNRISDIIEVITQESIYGINEVINHVPESVLVTLDNNLPIMYLNNLLSTGIHASLACDNHDLCSIDTKLMFMSNLTIDNYLNRIKTLHELMRVTGEFPSVDYTSKTLSKLSDFNMDNIDIGTRDKTNIAIDRNTSISGNIISTIISNYLTMVMRESLIGNLNMDFDYTDGVFTSNVYNFKTGVFNNEILLNDPENDIANMIETMVLPTLVKHCAGNMNATISIDILSASTVILTHGENEEETFRYPLYMDAVASPCISNDTAELNTLIQNITPLLDIVLNHK